MDGHNDGHSVVEHGAEYGDGHNEADDDDIEVKSHDDDLLCSLVAIESLGHAVGLWSRLELVLN